MMASKPALCFESGCSLAKSGSGFVPPEVGSRYESTRYLLIGESPGEAEARDSLPFRPYAQSGSLLTDAMREVSISRSEVAICNVLSCRPPKDYLEGAPYSYNAISHCTENYLRGVINDLQPRAILALGGTAYRTLTSAPKGRYGTLDYSRGYVVPGAGVAEGIPVIATYHPAFLRRGAAHLTPLLQRDLRRGFLLAIGRLVEGRHYAIRLESLGLKYQTAPTLNEAWDYANNIDPDLPLAFDIETPMSTRSDEDERTSFTDRDIKLFQCTQERGRGIALPFRDEFIECVRAILERSRIRVGFNNWSFDDPVLAANGIDVGSTDDAMVLFGFAQPDLPKNLQAAAQWCGFPFPWKHLNETELEFYGCADVDATLCVYEHMVKVLSGECVA
jgi:uracil-DNA glycosylase